MTVAFNRRAILTIGTVRIDSRGKDQSGNALRFSFNVSKNLKPEPNKATITVYNLTRDHQNAYQDGTAPAVQLEAGYGDDTSVIFLGSLRDAGTTKDSQGNHATVYESGDSEPQLRKARVNLSIAKGTNTDDVLRSVAKAVGVKDGNLADAARKIRSAFSGTGNVFSMGTVLSGSAARHMTDICRSLGLEWSVQDGKLQILERAKTLDKIAIKLTPTSGLLGAPSVDAKGMLSCESVLQPDVFPGRLLVLEADRIRGQYRIEETEHTGDTRANDWRIAIKAKRY